MEQYLAHITLHRRLSADELQHALLHLDKSKGEQLWLLGTKGSRRLVEDPAQYTMERWRTFAEHGLVYITWRQQWAFAPDVDAATELPVLMRPYDEAFAKKETPAPAKPAQLTLTEQPAEQATTTTT